MLELKIPPPVYMVLTAGLMWLLNKYFPIYGLISTPWNQIGYLFMLMGLSLDASSIMQFFRAKTTVNPMRPEQASGLVTSGIYRFTRNPMYVGLLLLLIGFAILQGSLSALLLVPLFIVVLTRQQIIPEETILEAKFGHKYIDYKMSVRRWL